MNAEARNFAPEIVKRCLMIYTRTSLTGDNPTVQRSLQRSVSAIRERLTTGMYRHYLARVRDEMQSPRETIGDETDVLYLSSSVLCDVFAENLPPGVSMPAWCEPMTLDEYTQRAFERPRMVLNSLLHRDRFTKDRRPSIGSWAISGDMVVVAVEPMLSRRTRDDIPDWILDDTASVAGQIAMNKDLLEDFLGHRVRPARRFLGLF